MNKIISLRDIKNNIIKGLPIEDARLENPLSFSELFVDGFCDKPIVLNNCEFYDLDLSMIQYKYPVVLSKTIFHKVSFYGSYFLKGIIIKDCNFNSLVDLMHGGHNSEESKFSLINNTFEDFVDFEDSWFQGPIELVQNRFNKGTNLLLDGQLGVTFDNPPFLKDNKGGLSVDYTY